MNMGKYAKETRKVNCSEFRQKLWLMTFKSPWLQPFSEHRNTSSSKQRKPMVLQELYPPGGIFLPQDWFFSLPLPLSICLSHPLHPLVLSIHLSLSPTLPFILPSLNLSLSVSFTTIYLSFLSSIYRAASSISLSLDVLKCLIWISAPTLQLTLPQSKLREHLISIVKINLPVLFFPPSVCLSREINRLSLPPTEECLFVMLSQDKKWRESIFGVLIV